MLEGGEQTRDPTYSTDAVQAWVLGVEADPTKVVGETFQLSSGREYAVSKILEECMKACGRTVKIVKRGYRPGEEGVKERFDISKARRALGYKPAVSLREGLKLTVDWLNTLTS